MTGKVLIIKDKGSSATWVTKRTGKVEVIPVRFKVELTPCKPGKPQLTNKYQYNCQVKTGPDAWSTVVIHIDLAAARDWLLRKGPDANAIDVHPR